MLENANILRAQEIRTRPRYDEDSIEGNTTEFVCYEQELVQAALDALLIRHLPRRH
jgi:hypothetical protein